MTALALTSALTDDRDEILARVDLENLFQAMGYPQGRNKLWTCPSPTHAQSGATPPVKISHEKDRDVWYCHGCGAGGSAIDLLTTATGCGVAEAFVDLRDLSGMADHTPPPRIVRPTPPPPPPLDPDRGRLTGDEAAQVLDAYLERRQWTREAANVFGLYAVHNPQQGDAVRHPYRSDGTTLWYQDRGTAGPKWANPVGIDRTLYATDLADAIAWALDPNEPGIIVVEGPADVIAMWHVAPGAAVVGIPGTEGTHRWAQRLAGLDVLIMTDPDDAGDKAAANMATQIHNGGGRSARIRPPADVDDWRRSDGDGAVAEGIQALADAAEWWNP
jgi:DNA primase